MDYGLGNVSDASLEQAFSTYDPDAASFWNVGLFETKSAAKTFGQNTGYVSLANGVIGAVGSIATGYYNSRIQKAQQEMAIRVQEYNARQAERAAQSALMSSNFKIGQISEKFEKVKSSQKAAMAANGIVLGVGSAAEVTASTDINKRRSIDNQYANGYSEASKYRMQGVNAQSQAAATAVGEVNAFQGLGNAAAALGTGIKDYIYYNDKNWLRSA
jgi:hypothetical protein|nr:MAG TPA: hypothetical protein [Caudoviricetes sp.]